MFSALDSGSGGLGLSPAWSHCVVFLGKALFIVPLSTYPGVYKWVPGNCWANLTECWGVVWGWGGGGGGGGSSNTPSLWSLSQFGFTYIVIECLFFSHPALAFFNQVDLLYGSVSEKCTVSSCPTMSAPGSV